MRQPVRARLRPEEMASDLPALRQPHHVPSLGRESEMGGRAGEHVGARESVVESRRVTLRASRGTMKARKPLLVQRGAWKNLSDRAEPSV